MGYTQKSAKKVIDLQRRSPHWKKLKIGLKTNMQKGIIEMVKVGDTVTVQITGEVAERYSDGSMLIRNTPGVMLTFFPNTS